MKKLLLSAMAVCAFGMTTVNAQDISYGVKAGLNLSNFSGDDTDELNNRTAFHIGGMLEIALSDVFSLQPEVLYSAQGATLSENGVDGSFNFSYINIPVMAKYYVTEGLSLEFGPQVGILVSAETEAEGTTSDIKDYITSSDFGLNFGMGYKLESGVNFSARYNLGLSNIDDTESTDEVQNAVFQLSIGYFF